MLSILLWIVFGALIGFIADYIDKSVTLGWLERIVVGIVGAFVGGTLASLFTGGGFDLTASAGFDVVSIVLAVLGALVALFVWKRIRGKRVVA